MRELPQSLVNYAAATRLKWQLAKRDSSDASPASAGEIAQLAEHQMQYWLQADFDRAALREQFKLANEKFFSIAVFEAKGKKLSLWEKPSHVVPRHSGVVRDLQIRTFNNRKALYRAFLQAALAKYDIDTHMVFAVDVNDIGREVMDFPLFGFQKKIGSRNILLPDVDFFHWNWYGGITDTLSYEDKKIAACFVGSSTGGRVTESKLASGALPRLRAAAYFVGNPNVDFRIAQAVQYDTERTKSLLEQQPFFSRPMSWPEQFAYRFLLSMDGNGAACSRLAVALKSNSVLVKFDSPYVLYYFSAMKPGRDYIAVSAEPDVEQIIDEELRTPGRFNTIAEGGKSFFARFLNKHSVLHYTGALLRNYARMYAGGVAAQG
jgi:hypothetical protein